MMRGLVVLLFLAVVLGCAPHRGGVEPPKRIGLVLGNSAYPTAPLRNPVNDATSLAAAFRRLEFDVVLGIDLTKAEMDSTIDRFAGSLAGAEVVVFFYAGHGVALDGVNYLVPTDFDIASDAHVISQLVSANSVLELISRSTTTTIVLLDACRDNPLRNSLTVELAAGTKRSLSVRGIQNVGRGLAETKGDVGTLIGYATQPGNTASDGLGENSPFTRALLEHLETEGLEVRAMLGRVRSSVVKETRNLQIPWDHSSLVAEFYFKKKRVPPPPPP